MAEVLDVAIALALGSERVVYADSDERRLQLAESLGAQLERTVRS